MTTKTPEDMFVNPMLALCFEAGMLQLDIQKYVADDAKRENMLDRLTRIAKLAECMKKPGQMRVSQVYRDDEPGPVTREYPFPVIRGGKE